MSYKDEDDGLIFPTRFGTPPGTSVERKMLDNAGGSGGIVRRYRLNVDGSRTSLRTRAGNPKFMTDKDGNKNFCPVLVPYVDSGFVDTTYNYNGLNDSSSGKLQYLIGRGGAVIPDQYVKLKDTHDWKENFGDGQAVNDDGVLYGGLPSNYSGLMRRMMQVWHGTSGEKKGTFYEVSPGMPCPKIDKHDPFSCRYVKTHGLYINAEGARWIIEVSSEGVFRIPITFLREFDTDDVKGFEEDRVGYFVDYNDFEAEAKEYWTITHFNHSEKVQIGDAPASYTEGYSPWYPWCGWGFDYKGQRATIALSRQHPSEPTWYQACLYELTITEASGVPSYATATKAEESTLATSINDYDDNTNAFIQCAVGNPGVLQTISLFSPVSVGATINAPIFSFYEESGTKQVYRFETYPSSGVTNQQNGDNGNPTTVTISATGTWLITKTGYGTVSVEFGPDKDVLYQSYQHPVQTVMDGLAREWFTGTTGGWAGFSNGDFPSQNTDRSGSRTHEEFRTGGDAIGDSGKGTHFGPGMFTRCVVTNGTNPDPQYNPWYRVCPGQFQEYTVRASLTYRYRLGSTSHGTSMWHYSTLLMTGYDRESSAFAHSKHSYTNAYNLSGNYDGYGLIGGTILESRPITGVVFTANSFTHGGGIQNGCAPWSTDDGVNYYPNVTVGWFDLYAASGSVMYTGNLYTDWDCFTQLSPPTINDSVPATGTLSRTLYLRVGGVQKVFAFDGDDIHQTRFGVDVVRFWIGASAFTGRGAQTLFYSENVNEKPKVDGLTGYPKALKSLYGFVGVF